MTWTLRAISAVFFAAVGQGALLFLAVQGIYPANWIAAILDLAENTIAIDGVWLMLVGTSGLLGLFLAQPIMATISRKNTREMGEEASKLILEVRLMTDEEKKDIHNVTSYHQTGGITAHTVNVGHGQRTVDQALANQFLTQLPKDESIDIVAVMGDQEGLAFAIEINAFLRANGFTTPHETNVSQAVFTGAVGPLTFDPSAIKLIVGRNI